MIEIIPELLKDIKAKEDVQKALEQTIELAKRGALDPLTATMAFGVMSLYENRQALEEIDRLKAEKEALEKQADWLAMELEKREHGCEWCGIYNCSSRTSPCGYQGPDNWREAARINCKKED